MTSRLLTMPNDREAEALAARALGREERLEDAAASPRPSLFRCPRRKARVSVASDLRELPANHVAVDRVRSQRQRAAVGHRVACVDGQVQDSLVNLVGIDVDPRQIVRQLGDDASAGEGLRNIPPRTTAFASVLV
jgi:hypothetical protein